jgi:hypothetical protein
VAALAPAAAGAEDVFSPGPLARGHEQIDGLSHCTDCHEAGKQHSPDHCLACHVELKDRLARGRGLHGRLPPAERDCQTCHREHQGRDAALVEWGPGGQDRFDHARTGVPLAGKHAKAPCAKCHEPRRVVDPVIRALLEKRPGRKTLLGVGATCASCHFDEHRAQISTDCRKCHDEFGWKPAKGFDHAKTTYRLLGKHAKVECLKCHPPKEDEATPPGTFPAPVVPAAFFVYKPVLHERCIDCHKKDPHQGRFGDWCESCHVVRSWKEMVGRGKDNVFHLKTRYPLEGAHVEVACRACHGPFSKEKARYKNMAFKACTDCHADAHVGQLARPDRPTPRCDACHSVRGWLPAKYELEDHAKSIYPLAGAHRTVACGACHPRDERLPHRAPARVKERLAVQQRPLRVSLAALARESEEKCETCHKDPHGGQFKPRAKPSACLACHTLASWSALTFDHTKDSRYPLLGKHAKAPCASCHPPVEGAPTRYRPLDLACASCHADPHAGQLSRAKGGASDCARCHDAASWKAVLFVHAPPFTKYVLKGKHAPLKCETCHPKTTVAGTTTVLYRPLPATCEGCHADFHKGAFRGFVP